MPFQAGCIIHSNLRSQTGLIVRTRPNRDKIGDILSTVKLKFITWPWKIIGHLCHVTASMVYHFIDIGEFKLELQSGNDQFRQKSMIRCPLRTWNLSHDLKSNRIPFMCHFKLCARFHSHWWIQTGVTARKQLNWGKMCFDLCDLVLWPLTVVLLHGHYFCQW